MANTAHAAEAVEAVQARLTAKLEAAQRRMEKAKAMRKMIKRKLAERRILVHPPAKLYHTR